MLAQQLERAPLVDRVTLHQVSMAAHKSPKAYRTQEFDLWGLAGMCGARMEEHLDPLRGVRQAGQRV